MLDWQPDDIRVGPGNPFDQQVPFLLNGVCTGLVERIYLREITADGDRIEWAERDIGHFGKDSLTMTAEVKQTNSRDNFVCPALKLFQHFVGVLHAARLSEQERFEINQCVRA